MPNRSKPPEAVRIDVSRELISPEAALEDYGVVLRTVSSIDPEATRIRRQKLTLMQMGEPAINETRSES